MKIQLAIEHILGSAVLHIHNMLGIEYGAVGMTAELLRFMKCQNFEQLENEIPGISFMDVEEWARNYAYSLYIHKQIIKDGAESFEILCQFKNTLPQVYADLLLNGEVLEARLRTQQLC